MSPTRKSMRHAASDCWWVLCVVGCVVFLQEVQAMQFNILVTTYETIMRDR